MPRSRQLLCVVYALVALLAGIATWSHNLAYFRPEEGLLAGFAFATGRFWRDTLATPASISITVDLGLLLVPLVALMVLESRRLGIRFVWLYVLLGVLVAISVTFPLFLIARERRLAARGEVSEDLPFRGADWIGLVACGGAFSVFALWALGR
jgi:Protein of unknown function DUF2834